MAGERERHRAALAKKIIRGRPYESVDDLLKVRGIGEKSLEKMRDYLCVE